MTNKTKAYSKIFIGILLVLLSFPSAVSGLLIVLGGILVKTNDAHKFGIAVGNSVVPSVIFLLGLWLLIKGYKQKRKY